MREREREECREGCFVVLGGLVTRNGEGFAGCLEEGYTAVMPSWCYEGAILGYWVKLRGLPENFFYFYFFNQDRV